VQPQVVIEVSGGVVQAVYAEDGTQVILVDWDNIKAGDRGGVFRTDRPTTMSDHLLREVEGAE
jgi:hypothetical protein